MQAAFHASRARLTVENSDLQPTDTLLSGTFEKAIQLGIKTLYFIRTEDGERLEIEMAAETPMNVFHIGEPVSILIPISAVRIFSLTLA